MGFLVKITTKTVVGLTYINPQPGPSTIGLREIPDT